MRISTEPGDPGYLTNLIEAMFFEVYFDGIRQGPETGRAIVTADEEEGLIRFHKQREGAPSYCLVLNDAGDAYAIFEERGVVEVRYRPDVPMEYRGFGV